MSAPAATGSGASVLDRVNRTLERTVVPTAVPPTAAVSLQSMAYDPLVRSVPLGSGVATCTTICIDEDYPALSDPMFQVTTPPAREPPPVADTKAVLAGTVSVITTPLAFSFPVLEYDRV